MLRARAVAAFALAAAFALPAMLLPFSSGSSHAAIREAFTLDSSLAGPERAFEAFDTGAIAVFDLDGDGVKEIVVHNDNNRLYVFDGATGALRAELTTRLPERWSTRELGGVAVGDVNGNGKPDLVVANSAAWLTAFELSRVQADGRLTFAKLWERFMDPKAEDPGYLERNPWVKPTAWPGLDGAPYLADFDRDGKDDILVQTDDMPGLWGLDGEGRTRWFHDWGDGNANPVAADLTGDRRLEAVFVDDGGRVFVFDASSGRARCTFDARDHGARPGSISVAAGLADLTGDGRLEIVFGTRHAVEDPEDDEWHLKQHAHFFALDASCRIVWHKQFEWANPHVYTKPVFLDVDGDGRLDVVWQDWNTVGHKPGDFEGTGPANLFVLDGPTGALISRWEVGAYWSNTNLALADVTGDGRVEILHVGPRGGQDGIRLTGLDGRDRGFLSAGVGWTVSRGAIVADLDGDDRLEVVFPVHRRSDHCPPRDLDVGCREGALRVFSTPSSAKPVHSGVSFFNQALDRADSTSAVTEPPEAPPPRPTPSPSPTPPSPTAPSPSPSPAAPSPEPTPPTPVATPEPSPGPSPEPSPGPSPDAEAPTPTPEPTGPTSGSPPLTPTPTPPGAPAKIPGPSGLLVLLLGGIVAPAMRRR